MVIALAAGAATLITIPADAASQTVKAKLVPRVVKVEQTAHVTGAVTPPAPGQKIRLQQLAVDDRGRQVWTAYKSKVLTSKSTYDFGIRKNAAGVFWFRVASPRDVTRAFDLSVAAVTHPSCTKLPYPVCLYRNVMEQVATGTGASATFRVTQPRVNRGDGLYSLVLLAVESADRRQAVEVGWLTGPGDAEAVNPDIRPHLFLRMRRNNKELPQGFGPNAALTPGTTVTFSVQFSKDRWNVSANGHIIYYFAADWWTSYRATFTKVGRIRVFGEVYAFSTSPKSDMGNGILGTKKGAAVVKNVKLLGGKATKPFTYDDLDAPKVYKIGNINKSCLTNCSMTYGGPGYP